VDDGLRAVLDAVRERVVTLELGHAPQGHPQHGPAVGVEDAIEASAACAMRRADARRAPTSTMANGSRQAATSVFFGMCVIMVTRRVSGRPRLAEVRACRVSIPRRSGGKLPQEAPTELPQPPADIALVPQ
jgi:hypothetical protein